MAEEDRERWDKRYRDAGRPDSPRLPDHFEPFAKRFRRADTAIEIACGAGRASVWLAQQGVHVTGYDISPVAVAQATALAQAHGVADRCTFVVADFDEGLPDGPQVDLILCNMFRSTRLDGPMIDRLQKKGVLAIAVLSEVGAEPGRFRVKPGELVDAFSRLKRIDSDEGNGIAWLVARKRKQQRGKESGEERFDSASRAAGRMRDARLRRDGFDGHRYQFGRSARTGWLAAGER